MPHLSSNKGRRKETLRPHWCVARTAYPVGMRDQNESKIKKGRLYLHTPVSISTHLYVNIRCAPATNMSQPGTSALKPPQPGMFLAGGVSSSGPELGMFFGFLAGVGSASRFSVPSWRFLAGVALVPRFLKNSWFPAGYSWLGWLFSETLSA